MTDKTPKDITDQLIDKQRWADILQRFIDVLRVNIFMIDTNGKPVLTPCKGRYGWSVLEASPLGIDLFNEKINMLDKFKQQGFYLEYHCPFDLHNFAVPIRAQENAPPIAYLIIGPVVLNYKLELEQYERLANEAGLDARKLLDTLGEIRTMSFVGIKSILDLLDEVARYTMQLKSQSSDLTKIQFYDRKLSEDINRDAQEILTSIYLDELLATFLDMALDMTKTECGSIMIINEKTGEMTIKVSRGLKNEIIRRTKIKIGEGLAGLAAKNNKQMVIHGQSGNNRIKRFLRRPDIKHSLISPLASENKVFGVLNLATRTEETALSEESLESLNLLSKLTSAAINSIQQRSATKQQP